jgi:carbon starvation protein
MLVLPGLALGIEIFREGGWLSRELYLLVGIGLATLALEVWMIAEAWVAWPRVRGVLEPPPSGVPAVATATSPRAEGGRSC